jgi:hypothetical protein
MAEDSAVDRLLRIVEEDLARADRRVAAYRRQNGVLIAGGILASTLATLLAGGMAAGGPAVANLVSGWRVGCTIVAVAAATGAVLTALSERLKVSEHLANATAAGAQLGAIRFSLRSSMPDLKQCEEQYRTTLERYRQYLA